MINNFPMYNPDDGSARYYHESWSNYIAVVANVTNESVPVLSASSVSTLHGTCGLPANSFTNLVVDVYVSDPEGAANGALFGYMYFGAPSAGTPGGWGFVQGKTYLGGFLDNGPYDSNPVVGAFSLNIASLGLAAGTKVTGYRDLQPVRAASDHQHPLAAPVARRWLGPVTTAAHTLRARRWTIVWIWRATGLRHLRSVDDGRLRPDQWHHRSDAASTSSIESGRPSRA